jgi:Ca2+-binding EF-hand superfamily protein
VILGALALIVYPAMTIGQRPGFVESQYASLPPWFKELDKDRDGQISFYEWRKGGKKLTDFRKFDLNDDGFITPEEVLRVLKKPVELKPKNGQLSYKGAIEDVGEQYRGKKSYKIFLIKLAKGKTYQIDHQSPAYQAFLALEDFEGTPLEEGASPNVGGNAQIVFHVEEAGTYRLIVTSVGGFKTGEFSLSVRYGSNLPKGLPAWFKELDKDGDGQISLFEWRKAGKKISDFHKYDLDGNGLITPDEVLALMKRSFDLKLDEGEVDYEGNIEEAPEKHRGKKYFKVFSVKFEKGKTYQIDHKSKAFDAYLYLENADGELLAEDDDGGEGLNSRIKFHAEKTGIYRIIATGVGGGRPGPFSFSVRLLNGSGGNLPKGLPAWFQELDTNGDGQISLREWREGGKKLSEFREYDLDDDGLITPDEVLRCLKKAIDLRLEDGQATYQDTMEEVGERYRGKKSYKVFAVKLEKGKTYQLDLISEVFQGFLYLEDSEGEVLKEKSAPNIGANVRVVVRADRTGIYRIVATSLGGFRTGYFTLTIRYGRSLPQGLPAWFQELDTDGDGQICLREWREGGKEISEFRQWDLDNDGLITTDEVLQFLKKAYELKLDDGQAEYDGTLEEAPEPYRGKRSFMIFTVKLKQGKTYRIENSSDVFQAFLFLEDADGNVLLENSSPKVGGAARLQFRAEEAGTYRIIAARQSGPRSGDFSLSVRFGPNLPRGLPPWFQELDTDGDGQISFREWREGGKKLSEFRAYDLDNDGFITPDEILRRLKDSFELSMDRDKTNHKGTLEVADEPYRDKKAYTILTIKLKQGKTYVIDLAGENYQAFLYLEDAHGDVLEENGAAKNGTDARIVFFAEKGGTYRLVATSVNGNKKGNYSLSVRPATKLPEGLPSWFHELDKDGDGQISLYEWRKGGKTIDEFSRYDLNNDGLITPEEVLRVLKK